MTPYQPPRGDLDRRSELTNPPTYSMGDGPEVAEKLRGLCARLVAKGKQKKAVNEFCIGFMPPPRESPDEMSPYVAYAMYGVTALVVAAACMWLHRVTPTRGRSFVGHAVFATCAAVFIMLTPEDYQDEIFSPAGYIHSFNCASGVSFLSVLHWF